MPDDTQEAKFKTREAYLQAAIRGLDARLFRPQGYPLPKNIRVSCSWPSRGGLGKRRRVLGEAWHHTNSKDDHYEIFITPNVDDVMRMIDILAHECVHIAAGFEHGHRGEFKKLALAIGLEGRMTATVAGDAFKQRVWPLITQLGPYPHGRLGPERPGSDDTTKTSARRKQSTRLRKAICEHCGYTIRLARVWISDDMPVCPDPSCGGHDCRMAIF